MTQSYDFSSPKPPPPASSPPSPSRRRLPSRPLLIVLAVIVVGAGAAFTLVRRSGDGTSPDPRFCDVSLQLGQALGNAGVPAVGAIPESVRPEAIKKALDSLGGSLDGLEQSAPAKVRGDVKRVLADLRAAAAGDVARARAPGFVSAEKQIAQVQQPPGGCPQIAVGTTSGDG